MASFALRLRRWHRWHALAMSLIVLMAAGSGLLHTWMGMTQLPPPPPVPESPLDLAAVRIAPAELPALVGSPIQSASLRRIAGGPWWQVALAAGGMAYVDAISGHSATDADQRYAGEIASRHAGGAPVRHVRHLAAFDREYGPIFRVLPVHRFDLDDAHGTRVYVSTRTGTVTRLTDDRRQREADLFSLLHKWSFIAHKPTRDAALLIAMGGIILLALSGLILFLITRRGSRPGPPPAPAA